MELPISRSYWQQMMRILADEFLFLYSMEKAFADPCHAWLRIKVVESGCKCFHPDRSFEFVLVRTAEIGRHLPLQFAKLWQINTLVVAWQRR
jgi:hypothetical protein